jgi:tape measure domain-containing protein
MAQKKELQIKLTVDTADAARKVDTITAELARLGITATNTFETANVATGKTEVKLKVLSNTIQKLADAYRAVESLASDLNSKASAAPVKLPTSLEAIAAFEAAKKALFLKDLNEAESKLRSSLAVQLALQKDGANSITAIKLAESEKIRILYKREEEALERLNAKFVAGTLSWIQSAAQRNDVLNITNEKILRLNANTTAQIAAAQALTDKQNALSAAAQRVVEAEQRLGQLRSTSTSAKYSATGYSQAEVNAAVEAQRALAAAHNATGAAVRKSVEEHKNLFVHIAEIAGVYKLLNATLSYTRQALLNIPKAGIEQQATESALLGIFGTEQTEKNLKLVSDLADRAGLSLNTLEQAYRRFAPSAKLAGAGLDELNKVFVQFAETGTILHLTEDKVNAVFLALDQMYAKGTVQSEEIKRQLGNVLPGEVEVGAKAIGKTPDVFLAMMKKNEVITKEFIPKFAELYRTTFGGENDKVFLLTSTRLLSNLQRLVTEYTRINRGLFKETEDIMNFFARNIGSGLKSITENVGGLIQVFEFLAVVLLTRLVFATTSWTIAIGRNLLAQYAFITTTEIMTGKVISSTFSITKLKESILGLHTSMLIFSRTPLGFATVALGAIASFTALTTSIAGARLEYGKLVHASQTEILNLKLQAQKDAKAGIDESESKAAQRLAAISKTTEASNKFFISYKNNQIELGTIFDKIMEGSLSAIKNLFSDTANYFHATIDFIEKLFTNPLQLIAEFVAEITIGISKALVTVTAGFQGIAIFGESILSDLANNNYVGIIERATTASAAAITNNLNPVLLKLDEVKQRYIHAFDMPGGNLEIFNSLSGFVTDELFDPLIAKQNEANKALLDGAQSIEGMEGTATDIAGSIEDIYSASNKYLKEQAERIKYTSDAIKLGIKAQSDAFEDQVKRAKVAGSPISEKIQIEKRAELTKQIQEAEAQRAKDTIALYDTQLNLQEEHSKKTIVNLEKAYDIIAKIENATSSVGAVSPTGALGLMQVQPSTLTDPGLGLQSINIDKNILKLEEYARKNKLLKGRDDDKIAELSTFATANAEKFANFGRQYYAKLVEYFKNDITKAAAAYNAGFGAVTQSIKMFGSDWLSHMSEETQKYTYMFAKSLDPKGTEHLLSLTNDRTKAIQEQAEISQQMNADNAKAATELLQYEKDRVIYIKGLKNELLAAQGQPLESQLSGVDLDFEQKRADALEKAGEEAVKIVDALQEAVKSSIKFEDHINKTGLALESLKNKEERINISLQAGLLTQQQAQEKLRNAREEAVLLAEKELYAINSTGRSLEEIIKLEQKRAELNNIKYGSLGVPQAISQEGVPDFLKVFDTKIGQLDDFKSQESKLLSEGIFKPENQSDQYKNLIAKYGTVTDAKLALDEKHANASSIVYANLFGGMFKLGSDTFQGLADASAKMYGANSRQARAAFETYKQMKILEITMNTAAAIMAALSREGIIGTISAGLITAMGATQIAVVASQQPPAAHGGLTSVPEEQTYLLNKGERVLSPNQNKDFTSYLKRRETVSSSPQVTIGSINVTVPASEEATPAEQAKLIGEAIRVQISAQIKQEISASTRAGGQLNPTVLSTAY